ncbi:MAG: AAA family ATPase [Aigarchaeota archaeon]|nr:AAA family ATPase [Aigarchaeota archaeon]MDW7985637.1 ATPase domain-containing protein [Nitrososphaerota archaeon]
MTEVYERVSTGIPKLDQMLGGGFIKGRTYLVTGETGVGKTILSLQFLLDGLRQNENAIYVSLDERIDGVLNGALSLGWDFWEYIRSGTFHPFEFRLFTSDLKRFGKESRAFVEAIEKVARGQPVSRIVLDPISALALGAGEEFIVREYLREIINMLEERMKATTLLTCDIPSASKKLSRFGFEEFLSSGVIVLGVVRFKGKLLKTIYVRKMRWSMTDSSVYIFEIEPGEGIVIKEPLSERLDKLSLEEL